MDFDNLYYFAHSLPIEQGRILIKVLNFGIMSEKNERLILTKNEGKILNKVIRKIYDRGEQNEGN